jgi:hypothetical protein
LPLVKSYKVNCVEPYSSKTCGAIHHRLGGNKGWKQVFKFTLL